MRWSGEISSSAAVLESPNYPPRLPPAGRRPPTASARASPWWRDTIKWPPSSSPPSRCRRAPAPRPPPRYVPRQRRRQAWDSWAAVTAGDMAAGLRWVTCSRGRGRGRGCLISSRAVTQNQKPQDGFWAYSGQVTCYRTLDRSPGSLMAVTSPPPPRSSTVKALV